MSERHEQQTEGGHWLTRPETIRRLWIGAGIVLALTVVAQFFVDIPGSFALSGSFGFGAWYGFGVCVLMVLAARVLGWLLKRPEGYYPTAGESEDSGKEDGHD